jgi:hypothetical protein
VNSSLESDAGCTPRSSAQQGYRDFFEQGLISLDEAEDLLIIYRLISRSYFPYVLLPENTSVSQLRSDRPFLLQAILTVASWKNRARQLVFEEELLKDLGVRFFAKGEKTLAILQGLLVYLAW